MRFLSFAAFLAAALAVTGCGGPKPRAQVSGKVTVAGKGPMPGGNIRFISVSDSKEVGGSVIKPDGTYDMPDAPVGECKVVIDNSHLDMAALSARSGGMGAPGMGSGMGMKGMGGMKGGPPAAGGGAPKSGDTAKMGEAAKGAEIPPEMSAKSEMAGQKYVKIDAAYAKAESTQLTATVVKGTNSFDFEVK